MSNNEKVTSKFTFTAVRDGEKIDLTDSLDNLRIPSMVPYGVDYEALGLGEPFADVDYWVADHSGVLKDTEVKALHSDIVILCGKADRGLNLFLKVKGCEPKGSFRRKLEILRNQNLTDGHPALCKAQEAILRLVDDDYIVAKRNALAHEPSFQPYEANRTKQYLELTRSTDQPLYSEYKTGKETKATIAWTETDLLRLKSQCEALCSHIDTLNRYSESTYTDRLLHK